MFCLIIKEVVARYCVATCLLAILFYLLWKIWKYIKLYAEFPTFPLMPYIIYSYVFNKIPRRLPFAAFFFQKLIFLAQRFQKEELFLLWGPEPLILIFGEDALKAFSNEQVTLTKADKYDLFKDYLGNGLITSDADTWKLHRKLLNPVFRVGFLKHKMQIFNNNADNLVKELEEEAKSEKSIDVLEFLKSCAFGVLCESVLGFDKTTSENEELMKRYINKVKTLTELMISIIIQPWLHFKFLRKFFPIGRKYAKLIDDVHNDVMKLILVMKEKIILRTTDRAFGNAYWEDSKEDYKETQKSFAHILLDHHLKDNSFTLTDVQHHVATFMQTGSDTVSHGVLWCLFLMGHHPDVQEQVYDEVNTLLEKSINYEDLHKLKYLECVIKEALRLYPPVPLYARKLNKDMQCGKYRVPKGTDIGFFTYMLHRNPKVYPDPETFDPGRFREGYHSIRSENYIPFANGNRNCIGKAFAMIEMKVTLAYVLRNFKVTSLEKREDVDVTWNIVLAPVRPQLFLFTPRN